MDEYDWSYLEVALLCWNLDDEMESPGWEDVDGVLDELAEGAVDLAVAIRRGIAPVYCFIEGEKSWASNGSSSSYLPAFEGVDALTTDAVVTLSHRVEEWLDGQGYVRLRKAVLDKLLPQGVAVPTILTDGPYREFDALFHWED